MSHLKGDAMPLSRIEAKLKTNQPVIEGAGCGDAKDRLVAGNCDCLGVMAVNLEFLLSQNHSRAHKQSDDDTVYRSHSSSLKTRRQTEDVKVSF